MATGRRKERKMNSKKKKRGREKGMVEVRGDGEKRGERGRLVKIMFFKKIKN